MNFKTTYALFGVLVVLLGTLAYVLVSGPKDDGGADRLFPSLHADDAPVKPDDITRVEIEKAAGGGKLTFERVDKDKWKLVEPRELAAESGRVSNLVESLHEARVVTEDSPIGTLAKAGLDKPTHTITLHGKDKKWTLDVGTVIPGTGEDMVAYVKSSDHKGKPLAIRKRQVEAALEGLNYFRGKDLLGEKTADVTGIVVAEGKKPPVELKKEKDRWLLVKPPYGSVDASDLVSRLGDLRVDHRSEKETDFVADGVEDLAKYHLDPAKADVLRITVTRGDGKDAKATTAVIGISKEVEGKKKYYAAVEEGKTRDVVQVNADSVKPFVELVADPGKHRYKGLALDTTRQPDAVDVTNGYGTLEFRRADNLKPWELYRDGKANAVDEMDVQALVTALMKKDVVTGFADAASKEKYGLTAKNLPTVKLYADSLDKPDEKAGGKPPYKKDAKPLAELRFGSTERDQVAVERVWDGESAVVLVPVALLDLVRKGPLAYLDKSMPKFNSSPRADQDVTKVEITQGGETTEVARATEKDPWKFTKPARLAGKPASGGTIGNLLDDLNSLRADELAAEKPDANDLASKYDLAKPPVRVVVTISKDKKDTPHTFDLGKSTDRGVYLKRGDRDIVYQVNPKILADLKQELRDKGVFTFDPDKVTSVTVKGWKNILGHVHTIAAEKKDGKWVAKTPAGLNLDADKVAALVREIRNIQVDKFVTFGKGPDVEADGLEVELGLPEKQTVTLVVGAADGAGFIAKSNQLKDEFFVMPRGSFEEVKKAPVYFTKK